MHKPLSYTDPHPFHLYFLSSFFAFKRLQYIEKDVDRLMPEIELLNPQEGSRRLAPLEQQVSNQQKTVKSLNIEYKRKVMADLSKEAKDLENNAATSVEEMGKVFQIRIRP